MSVNPRSCGGPAEEGGPPDFGAGDLLGPVTFTDATLDAAMGFGQPAGLPPEKGLVDFRQVAGACGYP